MHDTSLIELCNGLFSAGLTFSVNEKDLFTLKVQDSCLWQEGHPILREDKSKAVLDLYEKGLIKSLYRHILKTSMAKWKFFRMQF